MASVNRDGFAYDVCLSFAGEQRGYVERVAVALTARDIRVFYDAYERTSLWGKDLYSHLDYVYRKSANYCVIFVSKDYAKKVWTKHELRSALARALAENENYILPVRCDDTDLPGLRPQIGYIDLADVTPGELAELIADKLGIVDVNAENSRTEGLAGVQGGTSTLALAGIPPPQDAKAGPSAPLPEFSAQVRQRYCVALAQVGLVMPERWDAVALDNLRRAYPASDATGELLDALRMAAGALPLLARFDGHVIGMRKLQYLYWRHVGGCPSAGTAEEMLIEAASVSVVERHRSLIGPGYERERPIALARFMLSIAASQKALDADPHDPFLRELVDWLAGLPM